MKVITVSRMTVFVVSLMLLSACKATVKEGELVLVTPTPTATPTYDCSYYSEYDDLSTCQTTTLANCESEWKTFPNGGISLCYAPVTGYEACTTLYTGPNGAPWIYGPWGDVVCQAGANYRKYRSVVACSSTICACLAAPTVSQDCAPGAGCAFASPTPSSIPTCP